MRRFRSRTKFHWYSALPGRSSARVHSLISMIRRHRRHSDEGRRRVRAVLAGELQRQVAAK
jgi:hypothetical protein